MHCADKSEEIIVLDLFAGSGLYSLGYQRELFAGSCLGSLHDELPISKWIFCERDPESVKALKIRVNRYFKGKHVLIFDDPIDRLPEKLQYYIPVSKRGYRVSAGGGLDPFSIDVPSSLLVILQACALSLIVAFSFSYNALIYYRFFRI